jgi:hypothetical protein
MIRHLKNYEIDRKQWDSCISASPMGLAYQLSWYLDITNPGWEALVEDDYNTIMPLPVRKKLGLKYLVQPFLTQQLGIVSTKQILDNGDEFLKLISEKYSYININLNRNNVCSNPVFSTTAWNNHELDLNSSYSELEKKYSRRTKRNIKHAEESCLQLVDNISAEEFTQFKATYAEPKLNKRFRNILKNLVLYTTNNKIGKVLAARNPKGELISDAFYFWFKNRIYFSVTASSEEGKETSAMHLILDHIIQENAGNDKFIDFTGSNLKGVAYFNEGFGAIPESYCNIHMNRLPAVLKIFKKG